jgi:hypothetical protein
VTRLARRPLVLRVALLAIAAPATTHAQPPTPDPDPDPKTPAPVDVVVHGQASPSPRGVSDVRVTRDLLEASPRAQTSELLSAAPGFFVDHEDGEGLGNDVYLRGFDLDHGSGIEMRLGGVPINVPNHIQGQGYADASFIIPEVVRSIRVLEGPFDPRQGDAAIVGSAQFDLAVAERGYQAKATYGSFDQARLVLLAAPRGMDDETFVAVALRETSGFGESRAARSASAMGQYALDLGPRDRLRVTLTGYGASASLPGVVRQDDVNAGRIGYYDSYPGFGANQGVDASRAIAAATYEHRVGGGARSVAEAWLMGTAFRARQNYAGDLESSQIAPALAGLGDLFQTTNDEIAGGVNAHHRTASLRVADGVGVVLEPGLAVRAGHTDQSKDLLVPSTLAVWDRRTDASLTTLDAGAYLDLDARIGSHLRVSGGPRVDLLALGIDDHLAGLVPGVATAPSRDVNGFAVSPRVSVSYDAAGVTPVISYGEGFRSLDVDRLAPGAAPYSKVRSIEAGLRSSAAGGRFTTSLALFDTWVANELVFEAAAGGLETESASTRRGFVGSVVARPLDGMLVSSALSVTNAVFTTLVPGVSHYVPNVPAIVWRTDANVRGKVGALAGDRVSGRVGVGFTLLGGRHLTDAIVGPTSDVLNAGAALRWRFVEIGLDAYNVLGLTYADDEEVYVSNWSLRPGQQPASVATHVTAAPPRTLLGTLGLYF